MSRQKWQFAKIIVAFLGMFIARGALLGLREPRRASESLGAAESLGGSVRLYCGEIVERKKSLNLTNFIPNGLRIIQRFPENLRYL